jgi:hypothetical protein
MKKKRRYLKDLIAVDINKLVFETGYFEVQIGDILLSPLPSAIPMGAITFACSAII